MAFIHLPKPSQHPAFCSISQLSYSPSYCHTSLFLTEAICVTSHTFQAPFPLHPVSSSFAPRSQISASYITVGAVQLLPHIASSHSFPCDLHLSTFFIPPHSFPTSLIPNFIYLFIPPSIATCDPKYLKQSISSRNFPFRATLIHYHPPSSCTSLLSVCFHLLSVFSHY